MNSIRTRAAVAEGAGRPFIVRDVDVDEPREDEVLVRILGVGICHTDLVFKETQAIAPPAVLGHEGAGVVEAVGAKVTEVAPGDRVVITFRSCGVCNTCQGGDPAYCKDMPLLNFTGMRLDGSKALKLDGAPVGSNFFGQSSFAGHALTYVRNLVKVPDDLPLALMGPLGCGVQTGVGGVTRSLACRAGSTLLITGGGAVGLSAVMGGVIQGCSKIIVVEPHARRRALALELGATDVIAPGEGVDLAAAIRGIVPAGVDYVFETTGAPAVQAAVIKALAPKAVFGFVGISPPGTPLPGDMNSMMGLGVTFKGILEGDSDPATFIPQLMEHYRKGELPFDKLIATYKLDEINEAVAAQHRGDCVKAVLLLPGCAEADVASMHRSSKVQELA